MKYLKALLSFLLLVALASPALAQSDLSHIVKLAAGVNAAWFTGPETSFPSDIEACGNAAMSLSPHLSLVGDAAYGFDHSYFRGSGGARVTVTDTENPNFSVGLGISYHAASEPGVRPNEWCPEAAVGWLPFAERWPALSAVAKAGYGLKEKGSFAQAGLRWKIKLDGGAR